MSGSAPARVLAHYLPQFHPIPENDSWWGRGFTEWTNVARARPLYRRHRQPRLPGELGFYDLRLAETRAAQADLARGAGIEGFCYWHYWFGNGRRLLERPFDEVLASGEPDFPFCLAWANQTWTGIWHGAPGRILIEQQYPGRHDIERHFESLLTAFRDPRYITVDGRPLLYVQSPELIPTELQFASVWRELTRASGFPDAYLVGEKVDGVDASTLGFDAWVAPVSRYFPHRLAQTSRRGRLRRRRGPHRGPYEATIEAYAARARSAGELPMILPDWDNTPRSGRRGVVLTDRSVELFSRHVHYSLAEVTGRRAAERLVFLKSWNEWAEGNYLEPDWEEGSMYLDALTTILTEDGSTP